MNAERLLARFERIADAPEAVARFRRFILDLAVRGKLVPQVASDEPASELLNRIGSINSQISRKSRGRTSSQQPATPNQLPFSLPNTWTWAQFSDVVAIRSKLVDPRDFRHLPHIAPDSIESRTGKLLSYETVEESGVFSSKHLFEAGSLLYSKIRPELAKLTLVDFQGLCSADMYPLEPWIDRGYLKTFMLSEAFTQQATASANRLAMPKVNQETLSRIWIAVPPSNEQQRIVERVEELMQLCDRLSTVRAEREARRERLTMASFARLQTSDPDEARFAADARFALKILPTLTARRDQIQQLRQTILNLAVRGRLVSQDSNDEMPVVPISDDNEAPLAIPSTWIYTRLSKLLSEDTRNGYSRKPDDAPNGTPILRISAATIRSDGIVAEQEHKLISGIDSEAHVQYRLRPGDLLACRFNGNKSFVGRLSIFHDELHIEPIYPDKLIRVRVDPRKVEPEFIRLVGETDIVRTKIEAACATTGRKLGH